MHQVVEIEVKFIIFWGCVMRFSDVKEKYLYYVDFDPVQPSEFDKEHLAVVLKKNADKRTAIVMPLTSQNNGAGVNTALLPTIQDLPNRLKSDDSYAVYDKIRSVNYSRFKPIYKERQGNQIVEVKLEDETFKALIKMGTEHLETKLSLDEKLSLYGEKFDKSVNEKIVNLAYSIKKSNGDNEIVESIAAEIRSIINNERKLIYSETEMEDGIENIINKFLGVEIGEKS